MTKNEFIEKLTEALAYLPGRERIRILEYFEEMIDDRIENGMTEEEAIAAMDSIEDILKEAAPDALNRDIRTDCEEEKGVSGAKSFEFRSPVETLIANSESAELNILSAELPDGLTARVDSILSDDEECICTLENGTLRVKRKSLRQHGFSLRKLFSCNNSSITITLADPALVRSEIGASSGDVKLTGLVFTDSLDVGTASGNLEARSVAVQHNCTLHTASGDINAVNLTCGDKFEVQTTSGDAELFNILAGKVDVGTASGDITFNNAQCDDINSGSASGDIKLCDVTADNISAGSSSGDIVLSKVKCSGIIDVNSSSGDVEIRDAQCSGEVQLASRSGDVSGRLIPVEDYRYSARSRTGDVKVPHYEGSCPVEIQTSSGDITFKAY